MLEINLITMYIKRNHPTTWFQFLWNRNRGFAGRTESHGYFNDRSVTLDSDRCGGLAECAPGSAGCNSLPWSPCRAIPFMMYSCFQYQRLQPFQPFSPFTTEITRMDQLGLIIWFRRSIVPIAECSNGIRRSTPWPAPLNVAVASQRFHRLTSKS